MSNRTYTVQQIRYIWSPETQLVRIPQHHLQLKVNRVSRLAEMAYNAQVTYVRTNPYRIYIGARLPLVVVSAVEELKHVPERVNEVSVMYCSNLNVSGFNNTWDDLIGNVRPHNFDWVRGESVEEAYPRYTYVVGKIMFRRLGIEDMV